MVHVYKHSVSSCLRYLYYNRRKLSIRTSGEGLRWRGTTGEGATTVEVSRPCGGGGERIWQDEVGKSVTQKYCKQPGEGFSDVSDKKRPLRPNPFFAVLKDRPYTFNVLHLSSTMNRAVSRQIGAQGENL